MAAAVFLMATAIVLLLSRGHVAHRSAKTARAPHASRATTPPRKPRGPFAVGLFVLRLVDASRRIGSEPRTLVTIVRYPAVGAPSARDALNAQPERSAGPFPLVVFAHGYRLAPFTYTRLLHAWARAGYVVAAPFFPLTNAQARAVDRSDLTNQPQDLRFVISRLLAQRGPPLSGVVDGSRIALGGHSDGVDTALALAYSQARDRRVRAALGFSGAEIAAFTGFTNSARNLPLLAVQGTADSVNSPSGTYSYFAAAPRPKYLLRLLGAEHTAPYQSEQPHLGIVARVSVAFLDGYLKGDAAALRRLSALGSVPGLSTLKIDH
jgi:predicted dienelactone hydrolase